ncbi:flippase [Chimaeribacter arupi]|uniref:Flippase n=1 Tax=Nissabacter archeti TaxID=1917880 RepID=A0ABS5JBP4_9GAMM|nr:MULTISPECIES: flippase [Yersiniaceae]MBS0967375.1 flippase [Nissabacter archeti]MDV5141462.1 flippase [Chimaeribacter arupi]PLR43774.1 flippase [Chimaeribacter arupi]
MKPVIINACWLIAERVLFGFSGVFISIYVARYLQPAQFGTISYLLSIVAITVPLIQMGADNILFNRIARNPQSGIRLMLASARLRARWFTVTSAILLMWGWWYLEWTPFVMLVLVLISSYFQIQDVFKIYYDATLNSKRNTFINNGVLLLAILVRVAMVKYELSLVWFVMPYILSSAVPYLIRRAMFMREHPAPAQMPASRALTDRYSRYLMVVGLPLSLSALSIVIYTRIDQVMLESMVGAHAVGLYSAATTLCYAWTFVPMALITSLMATVVGARDADEQADMIRMLFLIILIVMLPIVGFYLLFGGQLLTMLFGAGFSEASAIVPLCTFTALCSVLGTLSMRVMVLYSGYRFIAFKMPLVALVNIALNWMLIPRYGIAGAAMSTLVAEFLSFFLFNIFFRKGKITVLQLTCYQSIPVVNRKVKSYVKKFS